MRYPKSVRAAIVRRTVPCTMVSVLRTSSGTVMREIFVFLWISLKMGLRLRLLVINDINHNVGVWITNSSISAVFSTWKSFVSQICDTKRLVHAPGRL